MFRQAFFTTRALRLAALPTAAAATSFRLIEASHSTMVVPRAQTQVRHYSAGTNHALLRAAAAAPPMVFPKSAAFTAPPVLSMTTTTSQQPASGLFRSSIMSTMNPAAATAPHPSTALLLQRCGFSSTGVRWIRVRGKETSSSSFLSNIYSPATTSSDEYSGGSTADSLTPHVRDHLFRVYSLVGGTVLAACVGSLLMIATPLAHAIPYWLPMVGGFVPLLWLSFAPPANMMLKTGLLLTFGLLEGMAIAPLVLMSSLKGVLLTSLMLTGAIFGGFSAAAYLAPRASMVAWQGPLFGGLMGLMGLSLFSIFYPTAIAHSLILYGGLALFSVMIASDTQAMIERARCGAGDHVQDAMQMFLNLINIFVRIMQIMGKD